MIYQKTKKIQEPVTETNKDKASADAVAESNTASAKTSEGGSNEPVKSKKNFQKRQTTKKKRKETSVLKFSVDI